MATRRPAPNRVPAVAVLVLLTALACIPVALLVNGNAAAWLLSAELGALAAARATQPESAIAPFNSRARWLDVTFMGLGCIALAVLAATVPTV